MYSASFEPGQEMAIANFFLAIFCLFTIGLPLLLVTRGNKTQANRDFFSGTFNPWSQAGKELKTTPVIFSDIDTLTEFKPKLENANLNNDENIYESISEIPSDINNSVGLDEVSDQISLTNDEVLAA